MPKLIFIGEEFSGRVYDLILEKTTVGRSDHNTLVIRDGSVSHTHCEILTHGPEVIVRDLDSANGTFVDGVRLDKQGQVKSGQVVRFGAVEARLDLEPPTSDESATDMTAVHAMSRAMRDQRRAQKNPKPADPSMRLEPDGLNTGSGDEIAVLPREPIREEKPVPELSVSPPAKSSKTTVVVFTAVLVLAIAALIWWILGGH